MWLASHGLDSPGIDNSTNFTVNCDGEDKCIAACLNDSLCTAISINYEPTGKCKPGKTNHYGRIKLFNAMNWTTWIRRMIIFKFSKLMYDYPIQHV